MGMIIFIIASGLTLVFGLMDVLNFGHGVFIALGAFVATSVLGAVHTPSGSIAAFAGEVTATSNAACPPDAFSIALDPTGPADARVLITLRGDAPGACEGVRLDWRLSAR